MDKKKKTTKKKRWWKKFLQLSTHPIPAEKVFKDKKKYNRKREKENVKKEIQDRY